MPFRCAEVCPKGVQTMVNSGRWIFSRQIDHLPGGKLAYFK
ncbi:hypothetical protein L681_08065 [Stenotrophomonas maltophilia MF89]|nr:hypothetical protein L681_08065 [Stenotrophomonas maltophilia MF89]